MKYSIIALMAPFILAANVSAQDIDKCLNISVASARLACFDEAHKTPESIRFPDALAPVDIVPSKPQQSQPTQLVTPALTSEELFGRNANQIEALNRGSDEKLKEITSNIKSSELRNGQKVRVTLENDQVWQQASSDNTRIIGSRLKRQTSAVIKRGLFGSYTMKMEPWGRTMKVKRLK